MFILTGIIGVFQLFEGPKSEHGRYNAAFHGQGAGDLGQVGLHHSRHDDDPAQGHHHAAEGDHDPAQGDDHHAQGDPIGVEADRHGDRDPASDDPADLLPLLDLPDLPVRR
jgi:hypothetical protein